MLRRPQCSKLQPPCSVIVYTDIDICFFTQPVASIAEFFEVLRQAREDADPGWKLFIDQMTQRLGQLQAQRQQQGLHSFAFICKLSLLLKTLKPQPAQSEGLTRERIRHHTSCKFRHPSPACDVLDKSQCYNHCAVLGMKCAVQAVRTGLSRWMVCDWGRSLYSSAFDGSSSPVTSRT